MMSTIKMQHARAGAAAIAAVLALSPTYAAGPRPIIDLSQSPALSNEGKAPPAKPAGPPPVMTIGGAPIDERTLEIGGGGLAVVVLGGAVIAMNRRRRRREDEEAWQYDEEVPAEEPSAHIESREEPMVLTDQVAEPEPAIVAPPASAFAWGDGPSDDSRDCSELDGWIERAKCGPTEDNPSQSLKKRMKRAAFFEKRDREVAAGEAAPLDPDAGLPGAMLEEQETA